MKSDPSRNISPDIDLGLFEDVLLDPTAPPVPPAANQPTETTAKDDPHPTSAANASKSDIVTIPADVRLLILERGEYSLTIAGYSGKRTKSPSHPLAGVDVVVVPGQPADAVTVVSPLGSVPPWPYDRDLRLGVTVTADSAPLSVITYRPDGLATPALRIAKLR
jgi:hypothetical protein